MADKDFGSDLWKNLQAVKLSKDGGLEAPVRANGKDGIVVGVDAVAASEAAARNSSSDEAPRDRWWRRLARRT